MAKERKDLFNWKGAGVTLVGDPVKPGDQAPDATLTAQDLSDVALSKWADKIRVLNVVPSLDTAVCDQQTKRFNSEAITWGDKVVVLTISMDLPFAQKRWCGATGSDKVVTLSDYRLRDFGDKWGLYVKEKGLLARSVWVIDTKGIVNLAQITRDVGELPNFDAAIEAVRGLTR